jgi:hypothetical protein
MPNSTIAGRDKNQIRVLFPPHIDKPQILKYPTMDGFVSAHNPALLNAFPAEKN